MPPLVSFGFEGETWLLTEIIPPDTLSAATVELKAKVSWLMCKEICIPGRARLALALPVGPEAVMSDSARKIFAEARRNIPAEATDWSFRVAVSDESITLHATPPAGAPPLTSLQLFPVEKGIVINGTPGVLETTESGYSLTLPRETTANSLPENFTAVLVGQPTLSRDSARPAAAISLPLGGPAPAAAPVSTPAPVRGLGMISLFAFLGGIILNLMPCVFPVISLKILGFVKQAGENPRAVWHHGLVFAAGVMASFWALAGILIALRAGGATIGWGFQLQSPEVLIFLSLLFVILALNLFGVFEFGLSLTSAGGSVTQKQGWSGSFFSGVLATVIATPCTAPFMGVALGYALTQPPRVSMLVFTALALGMATPYLLLSRFPALLKKLPRPGAWMETMKQLMGFFLLATVVWLYWVLSALVAPSTLTWVFAAFVLAGLGAWTLGKWDTLSRSTPVRWRGRLAGLGLLALSAMTGLNHIERADAALSGETASEWLAFSPEKLAELRAEGKPVFIDFTAKWCLTCQVNKMTVLRTAEIMAAFRERGVALLYADWTDENEVITRELATHGRQSVPLYAFYSGHANNPPVLLPELLTRKIVLDVLKKTD
jgi:thiol:disulfide interchange protein DsbD